MMQTEGKLLRIEPSWFGSLVLAHRQAARLTQEELATAAGLSDRTLRNLERGGARTARRGSVEALSDALGLDSEHRAEFLTAARSSRRLATRSDAGNEVPPVSQEVMGSLCAPPAMVSDFVGRDAELTQLRSWTAEARDASAGLVAALIGPGGVGKTTLAVAAAHHLAEAFPDGCLAIDLRGMGEHPVSVSTALDRMLRSMGVHTSQVPHTVAEQSTLYRSLLAGRRVLVMLDDVVDEAQIRPLLATAQGCLTVITSRQALAGLECARWLSLDSLPYHDAVELVTSIVTPERVAAEPRAVRELVELCGNLPLAVRVAGNRLARRPQWSIASLVSQLRDERTRLSALTAGDLRMRSVFAVSYHRLSEPGRRMFRRLALVPGADFGVELAAITADTQQSDAVDQLEELADASLVQAATSPNRYRFHDLIRLFAGERLDAEETVDARRHAADEVFGHLLHTAAAAARCFSPNEACQESKPVSSEVRKQAARWLQDEASNWLAALRYAGSSKSS